MYGVHRCLSVYLAGPRPETLKLEKRKRKISNKTFQYTLNLLDQHLMFEAAQNSVYTSLKIIRCLLYLCLNKEYAEGGMTTLSSQTKLPNKVPTGRTLRNRFQTINAKEAHENLTEANNALIGKLRKLGVFRRKVTVAIDFTRNLFYGDHEHTPRVRGGKFEKGTCYGYVYASIHIVQAGKRLTIYTMPIDEFTEKVDVVEKLLHEAKTRGIHIDYVLLDREFDTQEVIKLLRPAPQVHHACSQEKKCERGNSPIPQERSASCSEEFSPRQNQIHPRDIR
jgi:hypothetical protein